MSKLDRAAELEIPIVVTEQYPQGLGKTERAGAVLTSVEAALFELLGGSDAAEFKRVQALVL